MFATGRTLCQTVQNRQFSQSVRKTPVNPNLTQPLPTDWPVVYLVTV